MSEINIKYKIILKCKYENRGKLYSSVFVLKISSLSFKNSVKVILLNYLIYPMSLKNKYVTLAPIKIEYYNFIVYIIYHSLTKDKIKYKSNFVIK